MKYLAIAFVWLYRKLISPIKPPCCRMTPSCSAYALEAFRYRGFFVGGFLTVGRILRCNPFGPVGYDPVPRRITFKKIDLIRKKMGESVPDGNKIGVPSAIVAEPKKKRKVASLLPWDGCGLSK